MAGHDILFKKSDTEDVCPVPEEDVQSIPKRVDGLAKRSTVGWGEEGPVVKKSTVFDRVTSGS